MIIKDEYNGRLLIAHEPPRKDRLGFFIYATILSNEDQSKDGDTTVELDTESLLVNIVYNEKGFYFVSEKHSEQYSIFELDFSPSNIEESKRAAFRIMLGMNQTVHYV